MKREGLRVWSLITILVLVVLLPFIIWQLKDYKSLEIVILDKTVPSKDYREHKGLFWILNNQKISKINGDEYNHSSDYYGFYPRDNKDYYIKELPELKNPNMIYLADSYGVYEDEYYSENLSGERSKIIYGGLDLEEVDNIKKTVLKNGTTLLAEFNTFGSPTDSKVRGKMYELLGLEWTGWIGRYFEDLSLDGEVPSWAINNYNKQHDRDWQFNGGGFVFVNEGDKILILEDSKDIGDDGCIIEFSEDGRRFFNIDDRSRYNYWFDIVNPNNDSNVLAQFKIDIKDRGEEKLKKNNIPSVFPAIVKHENRAYKSYYFSGDFADIKDVPKLYRVYGYDKFKKVFSLNSKSNNTSFYWKVYVPIMKRILREVREEESVIKELVEIKTEGNVSYSGRVGEEKIQILKDGKWKNIIIKGVNMGIAKPGYFPGETAITKDEYSRWFKYIGEMNANAIRVYTLHPPDFYEALFEYNKTSKEPLFLFHGIWINEEELVKKQNSFDKYITDEFKDDIKKIVDVIHGNAEIEKKPGHAGGMYSYDISKYVIGWIVGIEWDPYVVKNTNEINKDENDYDGKYIYTKDASPFEIWLSNIMDYTLKYEMENYNWQRPISFTNWVTTDLLHHPSEPLENEDLVSINPNNIYVSDDFYPGTFASYHINPYYPDFLNYEEDYIRYVDQYGNRNNYAGYLNDLKKVHRMPILVAEFGVPSSRGLTHRNVYGMNQGFNSEKKQGKIDSKLFSNIVNEGYAGGLIFSWQDEWFKRTWNTMEYDNPHRRPYWSNAQTNEQQFGLLSFDDDKVKVDGYSEDWKKLSIKGSYKEGENLKNIYVTSDERYLYLRVNYGEKLDINKYTTYLLLDTKRGQGNSNIPNQLDLTSEREIDFIIKVNPKDESRILVDSYYDIFYYQYGHVLDMIPKLKYPNVKGNGTYHPIRLTLNKKQIIPSTKEAISLESYETGKLKMGISDPNSPNYNSLSDYYVNEDEKILEIRIPWLLLNVKDPSSHEVMGDVWSDGLDSKETTEGFYIGGLLVGENNKILESMPKIIDNRLKKEDFFRYHWVGWDKPSYSERLKKSYYIIKDTFSRYD